jgi:hypothetical protein
MTCYFAGQLLVVLCQFLYHTGSATSILPLGLRLALIRANLMA